MQSRLRAELLEAFPDDSVEPTVEDLNALPYLEAIVRETLRFNPPVELTARVAEGDDVIPLDREYLGKDGKARKHIECAILLHHTLRKWLILRTVHRVKKGDNFLIPIKVINRSKDVWGPDAEEFK
jgi:cytochrome P450